jgi:RND family efflux transporter MFP subunit
MGVRLTRVEKQPFAHTLRILGKVAEDETRVYSVTATVEGWITKAKPIPTWAFVKRNQILATFYSQEYLLPGTGLTYTLTAKERQEALARDGRDPKSANTPYALNLEQYKDSLRDLGMGEAQIENLLRKRRFMENVEIVSPIDGFITVRNVSQGQSFKNGDLLYQVADLRKVWILTDTYEDEAQYLKPGQSVRVVHPALKKSYQAKVSSALPQFDTKTRTLRVRLEMDNPGYVFKPGMFVDVVLPIRLPPAVTVPSDAIIDTGLTQRVFIARGNGLFEPREIKTGWRFGGRVEVVRGLKLGEQVAVAGTFLIDSESRMEAAAAGMIETLSRDPVCGNPVSIGKARKKGLRTVHRGKEYVFDSQDCLDRFLQNPDRYAAESNSGSPDPDQPQALPEKPKTLPGSS